MIGSLQVDVSAPTSDSTLSPENRGRAQRRGNAVIETALMAPWIFLLFIGVLDFGFYAYAAISTQQAARVAALYTSSGLANSSDQVTACRYAIQALQDLPNMSGINSCAADASMVSQSQPVAVTATSIPMDQDGDPASQVAVTYQTVPLIPIPGLMGQMTITRKAQMKVQS
jgi:Flp pilus assembly protein TadG